MGLLFKIFILLGIGVAAGAFIILDDNKISQQINKSVGGDAKNTVTVEANGAAVWFYQDHHHLDPEIFGTPDAPLKADVIPLSNRGISEDGTEYTTLNNSEVFSLDRESVSGNIKIKATNVTAFDYPGSQDTAELEANFKGPGGVDYKIVLTRLIPNFRASERWAYDQFYGGVAENHFLHGHSGYGVWFVPAEFSYLTIWGVSDIYRNEELVDTDRVLFLAVSEKATEEEFDDGNRTPTDPNNIIVHLVLTSTEVDENGLLHKDDLKTGFISEDGEEQKFFHVNFVENIKVTGNQFIN